MQPGSKPTLPDGIEIFRAGTRRAMNGREYTITAADLAASVAVYDPAKHEAPLVVGHPEHNHPAYGWVAGLQVAGDVLLVKHHQVEPQFAEMVADGRFKKRSAAFYAPDDATNPVPGTWYLRHVAYLGAQPPAVKGLKDIEFSQAADAVCFSDPLIPQEQSTMKTPEQLQAELDEANKRNKELEDQAAAEKKRADTAETQVANFGEQSKVQRHSANVAFCEAQVKAGKLLPKDQGRAVAVLDQLAAGEPVEFSEGDTKHKVSTLEFVKGLIEGAKAKVEFGEHAPGNAGDQVERGAAHGKSDAEIDKAAKQYAAQHKVNYSEALAAVTSFES
jgi:hypothetical protein